VRRPNREVSIFTLSALDVLAMATGTFVLIVVILMPYYRKTFHDHAAIEGVRVSVTATRAEIETLEEEAAAERVRLAAAQDAVSRLRAQAAEMESRITSEQQRASQAQTLADEYDKRIGEMESIVDQRVIEEMDLVFVIDTTRSMGPVLRELALNMRSIVRILERLVPSLRIGVVSYRDRDTGLPPVYALPLTSTSRSLDRILHFVAELKISPRPSKTPQEDVLLGLNRAFAMRLRPEAKQTIIVIGDAAEHFGDQARTLQRIRNFAFANDKRNLSALFVTTPAYLRYGRGDRDFFQVMAEAGGGAFNDHAGQMIESVLLSVLVE
jgi:hypothetical protein